MRIITILLFAAFGVGGGACHPSLPDKAECRERGRLLTARYLKKNQAKYRQVLHKTIAYLDTFTIDPVALRQQGIKGRKKLVELLDAYVSLHRYARGKAKGEMLERFRRAAQVTAHPQYHDMGRVGDKQFKQDATSYLRACYLMEKMGLDTRAYQAAIRKVRPRLDAHMHLRGSHQRMVFKHYYEHFGLQPPKELQQPFKDSIIASRRNPYLLALGHAYDLTHEVFTPYDYGGKLDSGFFSARDRSYLRHALRVQTTIHLAKRGVDIVGELLACIRYLGHHDMTVYRDGLAFLLASQRPNGSFGNYEKYRKERGDKLELDLYLHTTSVALDILPLAFDGPP